MNLYTADYRTYYPKMIGGGIIALIISVYFLNRGDLPRESFIHRSGTIAYLSSVSPFNQESEPKPKKVFLILNDFDKVFELFVGTDQGDFSPQINQLSELSVGDLVDIYYDENRKTRLNQVNRLLQYLDKDGELIYLRSKVDKYIGYFSMAIGLLVIAFGFYMKVNSD